MAESRDVLVTGMGIVSSVGLGVEEFWNSLVAGRAHFTPSDIDGVPFVAAVPDGWFEGIDRTTERQTDRTTHMAIVATRQALGDAGLDAEPDILRDACVVVGTGIGGIGSISAEFRVATEKGLRHMNPLVLTRGLANMTAAGLSIEFGIRGESLTCVSACASGTVALGAAARLIRGGGADVVVVTGVDASLTEQAVEPFRKLGALSRAEQREAASIPFARDRSGFVMGEGAATLVLEAREFAERRGVVAHGRISGYHGTSDGRHRIAPTYEGMHRCVAQLLQRFGCTEAIGYVNAHGTSTQTNDVLESQLIVDLLPHGPSVSSTKSYYGHPLGAAGAFEAIVALRTLTTRTVVPTIGVTPTMVDTEEIAANLALGEPQTFDGEAVLSTSFAFGGHNAAVLFSDA